MYGLNELRLILGRFDLLSQTEHMNIDRPVIPFHFPAPYGLDQLCTRYLSVAVFNEDFEKREFAGGQRHVFTAGRG